ncbi:FecR family protein [Sphingosinicella rhizophila]|uniref:FecR domain-containing protein n=1 Tax=Sphingosinicella rhizophila TaxID=3050082 RepID=A0ABU3Q719_9SPHN|nr:FecR domain-containing protein [Sphingosinicella sp. GR2756]MDT9599197.1 FecR domain-containing protein [Sphingosinicella sp. GR2756]
MTGAAHPISPQGQRLDEAAAAWLARRHEGLGPREEEAFLAWLGADPVHKQAYDRLAHGWAALDAMAAVPRISALRSEALVAHPPRRRLSAQWAAIAAMLLLAFIIGVGLFARPDRLGPDDARTAAAAAPRDLRTVKGERSTMMLADGSTITLNTDTRVRIAFAPAERRVILLAGQAYFEVAQDKARPFVVGAGDREVVALGTAFEVRFDRAKVAVALVEGKVKVRPRTDVETGSGASAAAELKPGEQLVFALNSPATSIRAADVANLTRWREGQVRFDAAPLAEAVAEMNRYSMMPIVIEDPRLAAMQVSGVFQTGQSRNFVAALTELFPVAAETTETEIQLRKRDAS